MTIFIMINIITYMISVILYVNNRRSVVVDNYMAGVSIHNDELTTSQNNNIKANKDISNEILFDKKMYIGKINILDTTNIDIARKTEFQSSIIKEIKSNTITTQELKTENPTLIEQTSKIKQTYEVNHYPETAEILQLFENIELIGKADINDAIIVSQMINKLPEHLIEGLKKWKIIITSENIAEKYTNRTGTYSGLTMAISKKIILDYRYYTDSLIHEIGHSVNINNNWKYTENQEFVNIFNEEKENIAFSNLKNGYYKINIDEYFAQSFELYYENSDLLYKTAPKTYLYIQKIYKNESLD